MPWRDIVEVAAGVVGGGFGKAGFDHYLSGRARVRKADQKRVAVVRAGAMHLRELGLAAYRDGRTQPALPEADGREIAEAANALGSRRLYRRWRAYERDAQELARLVRGGKTPDPRVELSARSRCERSYDRLLATLRRLEER